MKNVRRLVALTTVGMMGIAGCELAVDFDRTKIDSGAFDASISETSTDAPVAMDAQGDVAMTGDSAADAADASTSDSSDSATTADADDGSDGSDGADE